MKAEKMQGEVARTRNDVEIPILFSGEPEATACDALN
jgi:hypothetical protein